MNVVILAFIYLAIPDSGKVYTFEKSKKHLEIARNNIKVKFFPKT